MSSYSDPNQPYSSPPPDGGLGSFQQESTLGSLRDRARSKNLKSARVALIVAFAVTAIQATLEFVTMEAQADKVIEREISKMGPGFVVDQDKKKEVRDTIIRVGTLVCAGIAGMALVFLVLSFLVYRFPLFSTVGGLVIYLGYTLIMAYLVSMGGEVPMAAALIQGFIWKIIIIVGLVKGIQSAVAFQQEKQDYAPAT